MFPLFLHNLQMRFNILFYFQSHANTLLLLLYSEFSLIRFSSHFESSRGKLALKVFVILLHVMAKSKLFAQVRVSCEIAVNCEVSSNNSYQSFTNRLVI